MITGVKPASSQTQPLLNSKSQGIVRVEVTKWALFSPAVDWQTQRHWWLETHHPAEQRTWWNPQTIQICQSWLFFFLFSKEKPQLELFCLTLLWQMLRASIVEGHYFTWRVNQPIRASPLASHVACCYLNRKSPFSRIFEYSSKHVGPFFRESCFSSG